MVTLEKIHFVRTSKLFATKLLPFYNLLLVASLTKTNNPGAVAEWLKATVLKTVLPTGNGGSNPSCSVMSFANNEAAQHNCLCCARESKGLRCAKHRKSLARRGISASPAGKLTWTITAYISTADGPFVIFQGICLVDTR